MKKETITCLVCGESFANGSEFYSHRKVSHNLSSQDYYDEYIKNKDEGECYICGGVTRFRSMSYGYEHFCSTECRSINTGRRSKGNTYNKGRKQSSEQIRKRIENTDQVKKEEKRRDSMLERYGTLYHPFDEKNRSEKLSKSLKNKPHSKEHHEKVIESKRLNGTLSHNETTRRKISESLKLLYQNNNPYDIPVLCSKSVSTNSKYATGVCNGLHYRSSYEHLFLKYCQNKDIKVETAETKEFRVRYHDDFGKLHFYYPDFYLPEYGIVLEIKPISMFHFLNNCNKFHAASKEYNFSVLTEEELIDLDSFFDHLTSFE